MTELPVSRRPTAPSQVNPQLSHRPQPELLKVVAPAYQCLGRQVIRLLRLAWHDSTCCFTTDCVHKERACLQAGFTMPVASADGP